jgi:hypothetical protein
MATTTSARIRFVVRKTGRTFGVWDRTIVGRDVNGFPVNGVLVEGGFFRRLAALDAAVEWNEDRRNR